MNKDFVFIFMIVHIIILLSLAFTGFFDKTIYTPFEMVLAIIFLPFPTAPAIYGLCFGILESKESEER